MAFSASDAAFEGFRLAREHPRAIGLWSLIFFAYNLVSSALLIAMAGEALAEFLALGQAGAAADPERMLALFAQLAPANLLAGLLTLAVYAVLFAAITRAVLQPTQSARGFLRLGADEARQFVVLLVLSLASLALMFLITVVASFAAVIVGAASAPVGGLLSALGMIGMVVAVLWLWGRMSLAGPMTLDAGRISLANAWTLARGRGWLLCGALFLAVVLAAIVALLCMMIFAAIVAVVFGGAEVARLMLSPDFSSLQAYFTPAMIVWNAAGAVVNVLVLAIVAGMGARAYAELRRGG